MHMLLAGVFASVLWAKVIEPWLDNRKVEEAFVRPKIIGGLDDELV